MRYNLVSLPILGTIIFLHQFRLNLALSIPRTTNIIPPESANGYLGVESSRSLLESQGLSKRSPLPPNPRDYEDDPDESQRRNNRPIFDDSDGNDAPLNMFRNLPADVLPNLRINAELQLLLQNQQNAANNADVLPDLDGPEDSGTPSSPFTDTPLLNYDEMEAEPELLPNNNLEITNGVDEEMGAANADEHDTVSNAESDQNYLQGILNLLPGLQSPSGNSRRQSLFASPSIDGRQLGGDNEGRRRNSLPHGMPARAANNFGNFDPSAYGSPSMNGQASGNSRNINRNLFQLGLRGQHETSTQNSPFMEQIQINLGVQEHGESYSQSDDEIFRFPGVLSNTGLGTGQTNEFLPRQGTSRIDTTGGFGQHRVYEAIEENSDDAQSPMQTEDFS
ncbi:hypothetical protein ABW20_dc0106337 [Dactylellina cionopaga]|nr:hypothetical protein ABW20_dc0106337 [Dactylellina cionopaga]